MAVTIITEPRPNSAGSQEFTTNVDYQPNTLNLSPSLHHSSISNRMGHAVTTTVCMDTEKFDKGSVSRFSIRKLFCILLIQFLVISVIISLFFLHLNIVGVNNYNLSNIKLTFWFMILAGLVAIALTIVSYVRDWPSRKSPQNIILLGILTFSYILFGGILVAFFELEPKLHGIWMTVPVLVAFIVFSLQSRCR